MLTIGDTYKDTGIVNDCLRYTHKEGYPYPQTPGSCKGCMYSIDPRLYDAGCGHEKGHLPRNQRDTQAPRRE